MQRRDAKLLCCDLPLRWLLKRLQPGSGIQPCFYRERKHLRHNPSLCSRGLHPLKYPCAFNALECVGMIPVPVLGAAEDWRSGFPLTLVWEGWQTAFNRFEPPVCTSAWLAGVCVFGLSGFELTRSDMLKAAPCGCIWLSCLIQCYLATAFKARDCSRCVFPGYFVAEIWRWMGWLAWNKLSLQEVAAISRAREQDWQGSAN